MSLEGIDTTTYIKNIIDTELKDVVDIYKTYIDWVPEDDSYLSGKSTILIEGTEEAQVYIGSKSYFSKVKLIIGVYSDTKAQGKHVKDLMLASLKDYGFKQLEYQQRIDINERGEGSGRELTLVTLHNSAFNGIPYLRKN